MHEDTLASISGAAKKKIELLRESRLKYLSQQDWLDCL